MTEKGTWNPPNVTSISDQMLFVKLGCNRVCFFLLYKCEALDSSIKQQQSLHLPLYYTGALLYYITFCFENTGHTVTQLKLSGGGGHRWRTMLMIEHESKKTFERLLFICPGTCVSMRDCKKTENIQISLERQWTKIQWLWWSFKLWPQIKKQSRQWLQWKVVRMLQTWGLTDLPSESAERLTGCWNTNKRGASGLPVWALASHKVTREEGRKPEIITASPEQNL